MMTKEEIIYSGTLRKYILEYFTTISSGSNNKGTFWYENKWRVEVFPQEYISKGLISIPSTKVVIRSDEKTCNKLVKQFRMKFLSAGG